MPVKIKEQSLFSPGNLVRAAQDIYSSDVDPYLVELGSVGVILKGPTAERQRHFLVQFVNNVTWWVNGSEIEPWIKEK